MCGIIGVITKSGSVIDDGITLLSAENNRGEQACGAAAFDGKTIRRYCGEGLVREVFGKRDKKRWSKLVGSSLIMHTLYSTNDPLPGETVQPKTQHPLFFKFRGRRGVVVHNGNLNRLDTLRKRAIQNGYKFNSLTSDSEVIAAMLSTSKKDNFIEALEAIAKELEDHGSFSLALLFNGKLVGVRCGIRPLCIGKKYGKNGEPNSYIIASESCVFPTLDATRFLREVEPGELVVIGPEGQEKSIKWGTREKPGFCVCEFLYFAKPSSAFFGVTVSEFRIMAGRKSAEKHPVIADVIVPVPESGRRYSDGFSEISGIPTKDALEKNHYGPKNRTFMEERGTNRSENMRARLQAIPGALRGLRACATEDTLFRGSVLSKVVKMCREEGGAREFHGRICSPRACFRCHLGADIRTSNELLASTKTTSQINEQNIHADSLEYLTLTEFREALQEANLDPADFCLGCFTGKYPVLPPQK
jgi:amidophosphoribosyltransferase